MILILHALKHYLLENGITEDIYLTFQPSDPDTCITFRTVPGSEPDFKHNYDDAAYCLTSYTM